MDGFAVSVGAPQRRAEPGRTLRELDQLDAALDAHAERRQMLGQQAFGDGLIEEQHVRITRLQRIEIEARKTLAIGIEIRRAGAVAQVEKRLDEAMLLKQFERAGLNADGPRMGIRLQRLVDQTHGNMRARETHCGSKPGWARPNDQHRRRVE